MRICITILLLAFCSPCGWAADTSVRPAKWSVYFSPHGGCTEAVVEAHRWGVKVEVVLDRSQRTEKYSSATFVFNNGIPCFIDAQHAIAHNKVMVIDGQTVITGSFNFTKAAEQNNAENLLVIQVKEMATQYAQNWGAHRQHSEPYTGLSGDDHSQPRRKRRAD